jgi:DNA-directed RNA polymerase subunit M/transcription elongation factor TFIIS
MTCPSCGTTNWHVVDSNGAEYPETRIEFCECQECGHEFRNVLVA